MFLTLFSNCIPVKGINQSTLCDLQRGDIYIITNTFYEIIKKRYYELGSLPEAEDKLYSEFLLDNELAFLSSKIEQFEEISKEWDFPAKISNSIIEFQEINELKILNLLKQLDKLGCKYVEIRLYKIEVDIEIIEKVCTLLKEVDIGSFNLLIENGGNLTEINPLFFDIHPKLNNLTLFNSKKEEFFPINGKSLIKSPKSLSVNSCGNISPSFFSINIKTFTESLNHNSCLNKKISVDIDGNIKNCPSMSKSYGNIADVTLEKALNDIEFKRYWNMNKDKIKICSSCEFRYVCTDCRAFIEDPKNILSKPLKCGYDPATNKWEDWSENPLKKKTINYYKL